MSGWHASSLCIGVLTALAVAGAEARSLTFEERVEAQRAIEEVYWRHRSWPSANPTAKPALSDVLPEELLRQRVSDSLEQSAALAALWQRPVTPEQLQAELGRMAARTRDPEMLRELFAALGNDPYVIAETLARPSLVGRLIRSWYATDERSHGAAKREAQASLRECDRAACMPSLGGEYHVMTWRRSSEEDPAVRSDGDRARGLDAEEWRDQLAALSRRLGSAPDSLALDRLSALEETNDWFVVTAVLAQSEDEVRTATVSWPKVPFATWWSAERGRHGVHADSSRVTFSLPSLGSTGCEPDTWATLPGSGVPTPRFDHTAVWTGAEMIVWGGGMRTDEAVSTGARYDPVTDSWSPTSAAPLGERTDHTAVWTGTEMIVWGGRDETSTGDPYWKDGARYDPSTDTWVAISSGAGVPTGRYYHTAVWTGSAMIVWGGITPSGWTNTGGRYDLATNTWSPTSNAPTVPTVRVGHSAVWTGSEMIVWGGRIGSITYTNTGGRYDPVSNTWSPTSTGLDVPSPRGNFHTAVWTGSEMIVWGGVTHTGGSSTGPTNTGGRYFPATDTWSPTAVGPDTPGPRSLQAAVWTGSEMIVAGGDYFSFSSGEVFEFGGRYDPIANSWAPMSEPPNGIRLHGTAVWTGSEMIVWGGHYNDSSGERYDPSTDTWVPTFDGFAPLARDGNAIWTGAEMIVWGGVLGAMVSPPLYVVDAGARYTPATDGWTEMSSSGDGGSQSGAYDHTTVWTGREMIVWGGRYSNGCCIVDLRYDPTTDTWHAMSNGPSIARSGHSAVWTGSEMIVWGGLSSLDQPLQSGGRYDPRTDSWVLMRVEGMPAARWRHSTVWTGSEMIVWGGSSASGTLNTGARYDPRTDTWSPTPSTVPNVPAARHDHTAVWTGSEMIVWGGSGLFNTGGRYNPQTNAWLTTSTGAGVPAPRSEHSAVWTGSEMIVWGGRGVGGAVQTGARYDPASDGWLPTSIGNDVARARSDHAAVWTGSEMIVWSGDQGSAVGSGARYCACPNGAQYFLDMDGDGHGAPGVFVPSCGGTIDTGQAAIADDCDDGDASIYPSAPETCNGVDEDCDFVADEEAVGPDADGDLVPDCLESCPADPAKLDPGTCGCGVADSDADADGTPDCVDGCPADPEQRIPGLSGPEFQVNQYAPSLQGFPAVAALGDAFLVVWTSVGQAGVYGRRFDTQGNALGDEFRINEPTPAIATSQAVAAREASGFVVAWTENNPSGFGLGAFARRYDPVGQPLGDEFQVASSDRARVAGVALADTGVFVVVWEGVDASGSGIFGRWYDADGDPLGGEVLLSVRTSGDQRAPAVAYVGAAEFVVAWQGARSGAPGTEALARRFDLTGQALGGEIPLGASPLDECCVDVAGTADGWVAAWERQNGDGSAAAVFARRFDPAGAAAGPAFRVNTYTTGAQTLPAVTLDAAGNALVLWASWLQDGSGDGVYGQRFDALDDALSSEFPLNEYVASSQSYPAVAANGAGEFLAVWHSTGQDGSTLGIFAQRGVIDGDLDDDGNLDCFGPCMDATAGQCCRPSDGNLVPIDDGDVCTLDVCALDGSVSHSPTLPEPVGPSLRIDRMKGKAVLSWLPGSATSWNVYRGTIATGEPWEYDEGCFAAGLAVPVIADPERPGPGDTLYYLVSTVGCGGESAIGEPSAGGERFASPACP